MYLLNVYSIFKVREVFALTNQPEIFWFWQSEFEIFQKIFPTAFQEQKKPLSHHEDVIGAEIEKARWPKSAGLNHMNVSLSIGTWLQSQNLGRIFGVSSE